MDLVGRSWGEATFFRAGDQRPRVIPDTWVKQAATIFESHYPALVGAYATILVAWWALSFALRLWPASQEVHFDRPLKEFALALLGGVGVVLVGQVWVHGVRFPEGGVAGPLAAAVNQVAIFSPILIVPLLRRHSLDSVSCGGKLIPLRLLAGLGRTRLVVQGVSATACGAATVHLALAFSQSTPGHYDAELDERCTAAGPVRAEPFTTSVALPTLAPRSYSFAVRDTDGTFTAGALEVFSPGTAVVEPAQPATSDAPARLRVRGFGCPISGTPRIEGHVITLSFTSSCAGSFPRQQPHLFEVEQTVGPLPEGGYSVLALDNDPFGPALSRATLLVTPPAACVPADAVLCLQRLVCPATT